MKTGTLRHRVRIEEQTETRNAHGGITRAWAEASEGKRYAAIEPISGREFYEAQQVAADITHKVKIRYYAGLNTSHRIVRIHDSRVFDIEAVQNTDERNIEQVCMCKESV